MKSEVLRVEGLVRILESEIPVTLIKDASMSVNRGEIVAIVGPSGSGKSSLLYMLGLLDQPTSGKIFIEGQDVSAYNEDEIDNIRLTKIGYVFQFHFLLPEFTALENVMLPMRKLNRLSRKECEEKTRKSEREPLPFSRI